MLSRLNDGIIFNVSFKAVNANDECNYQFKDKGYTNINRILTNMYLFIQLCA